MDVTEVRKYAVRIPGVRTAQLNVPGRRLFASDIVTVSTSVQPK